MNTVTVTIYGETYPLKTEDDPEYVAAVARLVDEKMREISSSGKVVATSKIAVLAALHIADEFLKCRREGEEADHSLDELAGDMRRRLDRALEG